MIRLGQYRKICPKYMRSIGLRPIVRKPVEKFHLFTASVKLSLSFLDAAGAAPSLESS